VTVGEGFGSVCDGKIYVLHNIAPLV